MYLSVSDTIILCLKILKMLNGSQPTFVRYCYFHILSDISLCQLFPGAFFCKLFFKRALQNVSPSALPKTEELKLGWRLLSCFWFGSSYPFVEGSNVQQRSAAPTSENGHFSVAFSKFQSTAVPLPTLDSAYSTKSKSQEAHATARSRSVRHRGPADSPWRSKPWMAFTSDIVVRRTAVFFFVAIVLSSVWRSGSCGAGMFGLKSDQI